MEDSYAVDACQLGLPAFFQPREFLPQETFLQRRQDISFQGLPLAGYLAVVESAHMPLGIDQHQFPAVIGRRLRAFCVQLKQSFPGAGQEFPLLPVHSGRSCVTVQHFR